MEALVEAEGGGARGRVAPSIWVLTAGEKYEGRGGLSTFEGGFLGQMKSGGSVADR